MNRRPSPPRLAERLLAASVSDEAWRDSIVGDLREEYVVPQQTKGTSSARRWYWSQAFLIGARGVMARLGRRRCRGELLQRAEIETRAGWGAGFSRDFRHAWRTIRRRPGTSAVVIVTLALGLATNSTSGRLMESTLFGVVTSNAWQLAGLAALVAAVSLLASYIPARRTASLDPTMALRAE